MSLNFATLSQMTPQEIAEGRAQAKREYDAKMAMFAAVENFQKATGTHEQRPAQTATQTPLPLVAAAEARRPAPLAPADTDYSLRLLELASDLTFDEAEQLAKTEAAFDRVSLLKDKILLVVYQGDGLFPSAIANRLVDIKAVEPGYPPSFVSPKLSAYREKELVRMTPQGWRIGPAGRARILRAIMMKGSDNEA